MNEEILNNIANRIEEAGLKRDANVADLHHYVIAVEFEPNNCEKLFSEMPDAFEGCFDQHNPNTGKEESICMFYLEDIDEAQANEVIDWLQKNTIWSNVDVPQ